MISKCKICGKEINKSPSQVARGEGQYCSYNCRATPERGRKRPGISNENNVSWKGNEAGYNAIHAWAKRHHKKSEFCERCKKVKPKHLSNNSGKYLRDVNDYEWLCIKCHYNKDTRLNRRKKPTSGIEWKRITMQKARGKIP